MGGVDGSEGGEGRDEVERLRARVLELEEKLAEAERRAAMFAGLLEELPVPVAVQAADGILIELNRRNREMSGVPSREAVLGKYNMLDDPQAVGQGYAAAFRRALGGETTVMPPTSYDTKEGRIERTDDRVFWTQSSFHPVDIGGERYVISVNLDVTDRVRAQKAHEESTAFLHGIVENAPMLVFAKDREGHYRVVNRPFEQFLGISRADLLGKTDLELFPEHLAREYWKSDVSVFETGVPLVREDAYAIGDRTFHFVTTKFPLRDASGKVSNVGSIAVNITEQKEAEAQARALADEMLALQEATVRALSSPLLPIAEGVVVMPLIGHIDERRAEQVLATLLEGVVEHRARTVIVDVTGVPEIDAQVAHAILQAARAVGLLGAGVILTGMQSAIARTLVDLGADLGGIATRGTLRSGIAIALRQGSSRQSR